MAGGRARVQQGAQLRREDEERKKKRANCCRQLVKVTPMLGKNDDDTLHCTGRASAPPQRCSQSIFFSVLPPLRKGRFVWSERLSPSFFLASLSLSAHKLAGRGSLCPKAEEEGKRQRPRRNKKRRAMKKPERRKKERDEFLSFFPLFCYITHFWAGRRRQRRH